jgi:hypothetical protein
LREWNDIDQHSPETDARLKITALNHVIDILHKKDESIYEVIPLLDRMEQACTKVSCNSPLEDRIVNSCQEFWSLAGFIILDNLFKNLSKQKGIGEAVLNELGQFYDFISEGSKMVSKVEAVSPRIDSLRIDDIVVPDTLIYE